MARSKRVRSSSTALKAKTSSDDVGSKYKKLINRFYEPLILLRVLGKTRGNHSSTAEQDTASIQFARRRFLANLAYVCDYEKGGVTTTAIGLEQCPTEDVFWVAANSNASKCIQPFLRTILADFEVSFAPSERESVEAELVRRCADFAKSRVKKEIGLLQACISKGSRWLTHRGCEQGRITFTIISMQYCHLALV